MERLALKLWWISSTANYLLWGNWPEALSSRAYRNRFHWWFRIWYLFWDSFFSAGHCYRSYRYWRRKEHKFDENAPTQDEDEGQNP